MNYVAVSAMGKDGVARIYIYNRISKSIHSYWDDLIKAQEVAKDLNKMVGPYKRRAI